VSSLSSPGAAGSPWCRRFDSTSSVDHCGRASSQEGRPDPDRCSRAAATGPLPRSTPGRSRSAPSASTSPCHCQRVAGSTAPSRTLSAGKSTRSKPLRMASPSPAITIRSAPVSSTATRARPRMRAVGLIKQVARQAPGWASSIAWLLWPWRKRRVSPPSRRIKLTGVPQRLAALMPDVPLRLHRVGTGCAARGRPPAWRPGHPPGGRRSSRPARPRNPLPAVA